MDNINLLKHCVYHVVTSKPISLITGIALFSLTCANNHITMISHIMKKMHAAVIPLARWLHVLAYSTFYVLLDVYENG